MTYRKDIDGLRALAVIPVILYHLKLGCPGGFVGVDVFFVISGYLLTQLILKEVKAGKFSFQQFWIRRIRRLFPAMLATMAACLLLGWFILSDADYHDLGLATLSQAFAGSNVYFWLAVKAGYFGDSPVVRPTLHTWSLAVEEQFYFVLPVTIYLLSSRQQQKERLLWVSLAGLALLSFLISRETVQTSQNFSFFMLPSRAWELLLGSLASFMRLPANYRSLNHFFSLTGLAALTFCVLVYHERMAFPGVSALWPCLATGLILVGCEESGTHVSKLLRAGFLVSIGKASYSLYLWHWPLIAFYQYYSCRPMGHFSKIAILMSIFILGAISYSWIETPFRNQPRFSNPRIIFPLAILSTLTLASLSFCVAKLHGIPSRWGEKNLALLSGRADMSFTVELNLAKAAQGDFPQLGNPLCSPSFLLWGDSHAMGLAPALDVLAKKHHTSGFQATRSATPPAYQAFNQNSLGLVGEEWLRMRRCVINHLTHRPVANTVLAAYWSSYDSPQFRLNLCRTIDALQALETQVWLVKDVPHFEEEIPRLLMFDPTAQPNPEVDATGEFLQSLAQQYPQGGVKLLDPGSLLRVDDSTYKIESNGRALYRDGTHLTTTGAYFISPALEPIFKM